MSGSTSKGSKDVSADDEGIIEDEDGTIRFSMAALSNSGTGSGDDDTGGERRRAAKDEASDE